MNKEILNLIKTGEGLTLEFKENICSHLGKEICAFANTKGGKILLGVSDSGHISGIKITNELKSQIQSYARNIDLPIAVHLEDHENLLIVHILEGDKKPYSVNGQFFLRIGANCQQLNREEIREFFQKENLLAFDSQPNTQFNITEDFSHASFQHFLELARITGNLNEKDLLRNLYLLEGNHLKNAGVLFFCDNIKKYFLSATVTCVLYQGTSKTNILDRKEFDASIISNYDNALTYIYSKLNTRYIIKRERTEQLELPEEALREALINAIVHRDYYSTGHVQVDIYIDRLEITNPGGLVKGLTMKDFDKVSLPRNQLLMDLLLRVQKVEKVGSGIKRIKDAMKEVGLKVTFQSTGFFTITFQRARGVEKGVEKPSELIIDLMRKNPSISKKEIQAKSGLGKKAVDYNIEQLKSKGIITRIGPNKGGHWKVR
ncbi:MAG: ATP-binding protein [Nanoarchaeota archaeon]